MEICHALSPSTTDQNDCEEISGSRAASYTSLHLQAQRGFDPKDPFEIWAGCPGELHVCQEQLTLAECEWLKKDMDEEVFERGELKDIDDDRKEEKSRICSEIGIV